jgi:uncharacterized membrane protein
MAEGVINDDDNQHTVTVTVVTVIGILLLARKKGTAIKRLTAKQPYNKVGLWLRP